MKKAKSFIYGASILGIAGLICKIIGAFYRVPLTNIIDITGMGLYSLAYPIYSSLLTISTAGLPTAISKMVSERLVEGDEEGAYNVFRNAFYILAIFGLITGTALLAFGENIAAMMGDSRAALSMMAIAPSLFFVSIISAYRGYFQGHQQMTPTALSQVIEQIFKLLAGFAMAIFLMNRFADSEAKYAYAAAGAIGGVTVSELIALIFLRIIYGRGYKPAKKSRFRFNKQVVKKLAAIAIPITLGAMVMPLVDVLDASIVVNTLKTLPSFADRAVDMQGILKSMANPIVNMPAVLSVALAMSLVPAVAESFAQRDTKAVGEKSAMGLKFALLIGLPCCAGLFLLARPILELLYASRGAEALTIGAQLLRTLSFAILFLSLLQTMTGILQGMGKVMIPVRNLVIGAAVKVALTFLLVRQPEININGAPIGTVVCYAIAGILNLIAVIRHAGIRMDFYNILVKPLFSTALMALTVTLCIHFLPQGKLFTLVTIAVAAVVYVLSLLMLKTFSRADLQVMPGGGKLARIAGRFIRENNEED